MKASAFAAYIDHTCLKPDAQIKDIEQLCAEALQFHFKAVCVPPIWVKTAAGLLGASPVRVATVVGFPHGNSLSDTKAFETAILIKDGAEELDMVIQLGWLKAGLYDEVLMDIAAVVQAAEGNLVKVIVESSMLSEIELRAACDIVLNSGADFIKTSSGFNGQGARMEDVALMADIVGPDIGVKASGGIRDYASALSFIEAGATRLGMSASVQIIAEIA